MRQHRDYQTQAELDINAAWDSGHKNVLYVLPTGGGKTTIFSSILKSHVGAACVIAHRQELVGQISLSLASFEIPHRIVAPRKVVLAILHEQRKQLGSTYYDPNAAIGVAGVDTLVRRGGSMDHWRHQVTQWVTDEAHHVLRGNKWGNATTLFPNARGLGVTATPIRLDGKGLGRHADGVFDTMVCGPSMRDLINMGYLADYRIYAPPTDLNIDSIRITRGGEFNPDDVRDAISKSHIMGDVVEHYVRIANGKLGVTFASDVKTAGDITDRYNAAGIPAKMVHAGTPDSERRQYINAFRERRLLQLVNVDLFGEGFDVPGIEVVSSTRLTWSFAVFAQQFGRSLRPLPGKDCGIFIDHVGNVMRHGLPDAQREWTLDARERRVKGVRDPDMIPVTTCTNVECFRVYEASHPICPFCGVKPIPKARSTPQQVHGDLCELDPSVLRALRGEVDRIDGPVMVPNALPPNAEGALRRRWIERQQAQQALRSHIAIWAGWRRGEGMCDAEIYRRFFFKFGVDIMTAQTLNRSDADELRERIPI